MIEIGIKKECIKTPNGNVYSYDKKYDTLIELGYKKSTVIECDYTCAKICEKEMSISIEQVRVTRKEGIVKYLSNSNIIYSAVPRVYSKEKTLHSRPEQYLDWAIKLKKHGEVFVMFESYQDLMETVTFIRGLNKFIKDKGECPEFIRTLREFSRNIGYSDKVYAYFEEYIQNSITKGMHLTNRWQENSYPYWHDKFRTVLVDKICWYSGNGWSGIQFSGKCTEASDCSWHDSIVLQEKTDRYKNIDITKNSNNQTSILKKKEEDRQWRLNDNARVASEMRDVDYMLNSSYLNSGMTYDEDRKNESNCRKRVIVAGNGWMI